jgi:hypothetical protein
MREEKAMRVIASCSFIALAATASVAEAGLVNPLIPAWAGQANTQTATWDSFTQASGGANTPDGPGSAPFSLMNFAPGAFITGSGNIYSINSALYVMVTGGTRSNQLSPINVVMNVATSGSLLSYGSTRLSLFDSTGNSISFAPTSYEIRYDAPTPPQGSAQTVAFVWSLGSLPIAASGFRIEFMAGAPSMALDAVRLDLQYIPGPAPLALMGLAGLVSGRRRRS